MKKEECGCECGCNNVFGVVSVILGIVSLAMASVIFLGSVAGLILGIVGLVFALIQRKRANNKWVLWGMMLSIAGILINGIVLYQIISLTMDGLSNYQQLCTAAGGCEKVPAYLQAQQAAGLA